VTAATVPAHELAARLALCATGLPDGAQTLTAREAASACWRLSFALDKLAREYAAQALGQPIPVSTTTTEDRHHGL
jgi:hypothetical protein